MRFYVHLVCLGIVSCTSSGEVQETSAIPEAHADKADPFLGTGGHGHTYPGAARPFGMIQLSPDNGTEGWDWSSGYHYSDSVIAGFSHMHLSGTGIGDLYDLSVMPYYASEIVAGDPVSFSHLQEEAAPGYYQVQLDNGITAALTVTNRTGVHRYSYPPDSVRAVSVNPGFSINWDTPTSLEVRQVNDTTLTGHRFSTGWARDQRVYFAMVFSEPIDSFQSHAQDSGRYMVTFPPSPDELMIKVSLSSADTEGALENITQEATTWDFEVYQSDASQAWEKELGRVEAVTISPETDTIFYTALYHATLAPSLYSDVTGSYYSAGRGVQQAEGYQRYTVFSLWDTFRAVHPLFTILQPERTDDFMKSLLAFYKEQGLLPVWALQGNETNTMTGYHAIPVLADALFKGYLRGDEEEVYQAMLASAGQQIRGTDLYRKFGYIPADLDGWSVTKTLEYAYDDWCIAQVASYLGKEDDAAKFLARARSYRHLFDASTLFMRGKNQDGSWVSPFDPFYSEHGFEGMYIEGTAWQHSWFVPHDVSGMMNLFLSPDQFVRHLDSTFQVSSEMTGENVSIDISGLIGQYAHGNEPSHHIAYLYTYAGKPWKTQERVRQIMSEMYSTGPDGLAGNDDCGQMSAWYVFNALGFYPVNPADQRYVLGSPLITRAVIQVANDQTFSIIAHNNSAENIYIQQVRLNGKELGRTYLTHEEIMAGGTLEFTMGDQPSDWGTSPEARPPSMSDNL